MSAPDLLIIGGGAAGLSATAAARDIGLSVELLDERAALGGNYYAGADAASGSSGRFGAGYAKGAALLRDAGEIGLRPGSSAWRIEPDGTTRYIDADGHTGSVMPRRLLIATGAMERPVPIPGATLPGVMYAGAAQLMLKTFGSVPTGRSVLVGSGLLLLLLANQLVRFGAAPSAIIETTPTGRTLETLRGLPSALSVPSLLLEGIGMYRDLKKAGIPWHRNATGVSVLGDSRAKQVSFTNHDGQQKTVDADLVLMHDGVIPNDQVTRQLGCKHTWNAGQHCFHPVVDQWGETSLSGIFAAGDCTGIWGVQAAELSGEIAVFGIAHQLGLITRNERDQLARKPFRKRSRYTAFRPFVENSFPPSLSRAGTSTDDTVICRCENVTAGEIRLAVSQGATEPDQVKAFTRCGMGPCQGRSCSMAVAEIVHAQTNRGMDAVGRQDIRSPLKPIPLGSIAAARIDAEAAE